MIYDSDDVRILVSSVRSDGGCVGGGGGPDPLDPPPGSAPADALAYTRHRTYFRPVEKFVRLGVLFTGNNLNRRKI